MTMIQWVSGNSSVDFVKDVNDTIFLWAEKNYIVVRLKVLAWEDTYEGYLEFDYVPGSSAWKRGSDAFFIPKTVGHVARVCETGYGATPVGPDAGKSYSENVETKEDGFICAYHNMGSRFNVIARCKKQCSFCEETQKLKKQKP